MPPPPPRGWPRISLRALCVATTVAILAQILMGLIARETGRGLVFHLAGIVPVIAGVVLTAMRAAHEGKTRAGFTLPAHLTVLFLAAQFFLGTMVYINRGAPGLLTSHAVTAVLLLSCVLWITLRDQGSH